MTTNGCRACDGRGIHILRGRDENDLPTTIVRECLKCEGKGVTPQVLEALYLQAKALRAVSHPDTVPV